MSETTSLLKTFGREQQRVAIAPALVVQLALILVNGVDVIEFRPNQQPVLPPEERHETTFPGACFLLQSNRHVAQ